MPFRSAQKTVRLHTDPISTRAGFHIKVKQVECPSSVSTQIGGDSDRPWKPSGENHGNNWSTGIRDWNKPDPSHHHNHHQGSFHDEDADFSNVSGNRGSDFNSAGHHEVG